MADETIITQPAPNPAELSRAEERIRQLSEKVELTSKERDEKDRLLKESNEKFASLEKENTFNSGFADILGIHPAAKDHKDEIKAKVLAGYTPQDAAFAVLGPIGKIGSTPTGSPPPVAGGPAAVNQNATGQKTVGEMTQAERREALAKDIMFT